MKAKILSIVFVIFLIIAYITLNFIYTVDLNSKLKYLNFNYALAVLKYGISKIITFDDYLYANKTNTDVLKTNDSGDVVFNNKVVLTNSGKPLNKNTAYSDLELKILFVAADVAPKEGCNPNDVDKNGTLGCYIDTPDNN